tara:strand:- start:610 stop:783 length:174 start_codon:yes stop_codon:yes gene_type:complete
VEDLVYLLKAIRSSKMARKYFLIALSIFPKYLTTVQSFSFNDYQLNNFSDKLLISGW